MAPLVSNSESLSYFLNSTLCLKLTLTLTKNVTQTVANKERTVFGKTYIPFSFISIVSRTKLISQLLRLAYKIITLISLMSFFIYIYLHITKRTYNNSSDQRWLEKPVWLSESDHTLILCLNKTLVLYNDIEYKYSIWIKYFRKTTESNTK